MLISTPPMGDTLLSLTDEDHKALLKLGFAFGGLDTALADSFDECALLIRRHGFTAFLEVLESAEQELLRPPA